LRSVGVEEAQLPGARPALEARGSGESGEWDGGGNGDGASEAQTGGGRLWKQLEASSCVHALHFRKRCRAIACGGGPTDRG
jgi:hypothetical protein